MPFDPAAHLIKLQGKDYLEVRWRLAWLREAHPDAIIVTEIVQIDTAAEWAVIRATVTLPTGGSATGMALQRPTAIAKDYIANGETSAIGRALGALGFGTQHAVEFDQGEQVVDAPVTRPSPVAASAGAPIPPLPADNLAPRPEPGVTDALLRKLHATARDKGWTAEGVKTAMRDLWGVESSKQLSSRQAGELIDLIEDRLMVDRYDGKPVLVRVPVEPLVNQLADAVR
jgi:hypothetical protein